MSLAQAQQDRERAQRTRDWVLQQVRELERRLAVERRAFDEAETKLIEAEAAVRDMEVPS